MPAKTNNIVSLRGIIGLAALLFVMSLPAPLQAAVEDETRYLRSVSVKAGESLPEVTCIGCSVRVDGVVNGDTIAVAGDIVISGTVHGDAVAAGGCIRLLPGASVEGEAVAVGGTVSLEGAAAPKEGFESFPYFHIPGQRSLHPLGGLTFIVVNCVTALIGGLILRERRRKNLADAITFHPWATVLIGVAITVLWVFLWTGDAHWRPAQIAAWIAQAVVFVLLLCGCTGIAWLSGRLILPRSPSGIKLLAGSLVVSIVLLIPLFGSLVLAIALVVAFGSAAASGLGSDAHWIGSFRFCKPAAKGRL